MMSKTLKVIANMVYGLGVVIVLALLLVFIFGAKYVPNPNHMLGFSMREFAFIYAAIGTLPMLGATIVVYFLNDIGEKKLNKLYKVVFFFPAAVCCGCFLYIVGIFMIG